MICCKTLQKLIMNHLHSLTLCIWETHLDLLYGIDIERDRPGMHSNTSIYFHPSRPATYFVYATSMALHATPLNKHPSSK